MTLSQNNDSILKQSVRRAIGGGLSGAMAMTCQVGSLMWLRTTMNYQYKHGLTTKKTIQTLYKQGGIPRFYRGVIPALFQAPLSRFGDTAANSGVMYLLSNNNSTKDLPVGVKTLISSGCAATWRLCLMPLDAMKTNMQVHGKNGLKTLFSKVRFNGYSSLYHGSVASCGATFVGHYPWFLTYNYLNEYLPKGNTLPHELARNATIGFSSSVISDCCSNSIRVIKTYKQSSEIPVSYSNAIKNIISKDGITGLLSRGLKTRILANGFQGLLFTILWKGFEKRLVNNTPVIQDKL